jgi:threonine aldolase
MEFASDNWAGIAPPVKAALDQASDGFAPAYGGDDLTAQVAHRFNEVFETDVKVYFVGTGTAANSLALAALAKPGGTMFAYHDSHLATDECNAAEFQTGGNKIVRLNGAGGRYSAETLGVALNAAASWRDNQGRMAAVSLTQATEIGSVHTRDEIEAIAAVARDYGLPVHMDGARFANALVAMGCSPAEATWKAGIDVMSFGATKNGCWCADAVVFFNHELAKDFEFIRIRAGHLLSKSRFVAAQFQGYLENDTWLDLAGRANAAARRLADGIVACAYGRLAWDAPANEVFAIWTSETSLRLRAAGARFGEWDGRSALADAGLTGGENLLRLVTSFATTDDQIDRFLSELNGG